MNEAVTKVLHRYSKCLFLENFRDEVTLIKGCGKEDNCY